MLWSLILVVTIKYVVILLRADNSGEGGTLSLLALAQRALGRAGPRPLLLLGVAGAGLFYGDAAITPAISVLSAVEGSRSRPRPSTDYVVPITLAVLIGLFMVQSRGTGKVAAFFGPVMVLWFITLGSPAPGIADDPGVLWAINPAYAAMFFVHHPGVSLAVLGAICLSVTGAEALYADLGHFGRGRSAPLGSASSSRPSSSTISDRARWCSRNPAAIEHPLFRLVPESVVIPFVLLATAATIIASQAVITGAFSLTRQAIQLGLLPRLEIRFTSESHLGQIFLPRVNTLLLTGVILLVLVFQSSSELAHAYGIAVFGAMAVDTILSIIVINKRWRWSLPLTLRPCCRCCSSISPSSAPTC